MLNNFDMNLFIVLHALLEERSVTRAGERLGRTQSAISNSLKRLREYFGDPLLVRSPDGLTPTPLARDLAPSIAQIVNGASACITREKGFDPATAEAHFVVGAPDRFSLPVFLPLLERIGKEAPNISISLRATDRDYALRLIEEEEVDVAIGWFGSVPKHMCQTFAFEDQFVCLSRRDHALLQRNTEPTLEEILAYPHLVVSSTGGRHAAFDAILAESGLSRSIAATLTSFTIVPELLLRSNLVGVFTHRTSDYFAKRYALHVTPVPLEVAPIANHMVWHRKHDVDEAHVWLRDKIMQACAEPQ